VSETASEILVNIPGVVPLWQLQKDGVWRERPMAILGKPKKKSS